MKVQLKVVGAAGPQVCVEGVDEEGEDFVTMVNVGDEHVISASEVHIHEHNAPRVEYTTIADAEAAVEKGPLG